MDPERENEPKVKINKEPININEENLSSPSDVAPTSSNPGRYVAPGRKQRSIRDIKRDSDENKRNGGTPAFGDERKYASRRYRGGNNKKFAIIAGVLAALVLGFVAVGSLNHNATLALEANQYQINLSDSLIFGSGDSDASEFQYQIMPISISDSIAVTAASVEEVEVPAEGVITVTNDSSETQLLVATTRFRSDNGLIYRTPSAISIPAGGELTNVLVVADSPGESGNIASGEQFSVPGLDGTALEGEITAVSTSDFTGGFVGTRAIADESDVLEARSELEQDLADRIGIEAMSQIDTENVFIGISGEIEFTEAQDDSSETEARVGLRATANAIVVPENSLIAAIAETNSQIANSGKISLLNRESLDFNYTLEDEVLSLDIDGSITLGVLLESDTIAQALAGLSSEQVDQVLAEESGIKNYELSISPFWRSSLPDNTSRITVTIDNEIDRSIPIADTDEEPSSNPSDDGLGEVEDADTTVRTSLDDTEVDSLVEDLDTTN